VDASQPGSGIRVRVGQRQSFLSTGDNYSFPVAWVNSFIFVVV